MIDSLVFRFFLLVLILNFQFFYYYQTIRRLDCLFLLFGVELFVLVKFFFLKLLQGDIYYLNYFGNRVFLINQFLFDLEF